MFAAGTNRILADCILLQLIGMDRTPNQPSNRRTALPFRDGSWIAEHRCARASLGFYEGTRPGARYHAPAGIFNQAEPEPGEMLLPGFRSLPASGMPGLNRPC